MISQILLTALGVCVYLFVGLIMFYIVIDAKETDDEWIDDLRLFFMLFWPAIIVFGFVMAILFSIGWAGKKVDILIRKAFKK